MTYIFRLYWILESYLFFSFEVKQRLPWTIHVFPYFFFFLFFVYSIFFFDFVCNQVFVDHIRLTLVIYSNSHYINSFLFSYTVSARHLSAVLFILVFFLLSLCFRFHGFEKGIFIYWQLEFWHTLPMNVSRYVKDYNFFYTHVHAFIKWLNSKE